MDKKSTIGILLIFAVLVVFIYINKPSKKEVEAAKHRRDSIAMVQSAMQQEAEALSAKKAAEQSALPVSTFDDSTYAANQMRNLYGDFYLSASGNEEFIILENNLLRLTVSTKGVRFIQLN
jgi:YidC/Oxa1 family membrane protein insertase